MSNEAYSSSWSRAARETSGWAVGFILFAAIMMIMVGVFQAIQGLIAIFENEFYVATRNYLFQFDATTWGWIHCEDDGRGARPAGLTLGIHWPCCLESDLSAGRGGRPRHHRSDEVT